MVWDLATKKYYGVFHHPTKFWYRTCGPGACNLERKPGGALTQIHTHTHTVLQLGASPHTQTHTHTHTHTATTWSENQEPWHKYTHTHTHRATTWRHTHTHTHCYNLERKPGAVTQIHTHTHTHLKTGKVQPGRRAWKVTLGMTVQCAQRRRLLPLFGTRATRSAHCRPPAPIC